jgi:hypothetical protein
VQEIGLLLARGFLRLEFNRLLPSGVNSLLTGKIRGEFDQVFTL